MAERDLPGELRAVDAACAEHGHGGNGHLCLFRVVPGLSASVWEALKRELGLDAWEAAAGHSLPHLEGAPGLRLFLTREMERAKLCQQPLALALIAPENSPEGDASAEEIFALVRAQLRSFDFAARLELGGAPGSIGGTMPGTIAVVLSGTALAAAERVVGAMLRRIRQVLEPELVCSAGLVGYGGLAQLDAEALLDSAGKALERARMLGGNRLEVAPSADAALASRETLVRASEKHFLFTGKKLPD